jgi:GDP-4-dehydro-6-deoxy-D-mannose reductase
VQMVFVTGAEGFIGSRVLNRLRAGSYEVVAGVRNRARKLALERQGVRALVCDVADAINVARAVASVRPDAVVHLAGLSRVPEVDLDPLLGYQSLVVSTINVLDAVRRTVPRAKVLVASAGDVYGEAGSDGHPLNEDTPTQPVTAFGALKQAVEEAVHTYFRHSHLNVTIVRAFHCLGAGQPAQSFFGAVAERLAQWDRALHGEQLEWADLNCRRDLLHVDDVAAAYVLLLQKGRPNEVYNVCAGETRSCRDVVQQLANELVGPLTLADAETSEKQLQVLCGDNSKIRNELGWTPTRNLNDAVRELAGSFRKVAVGVAQ